MLLNSNIIRIETIPFEEIPFILRQRITSQTSVNLVDMFKSKMNCKSKSPKTGYICVEINP